MIEFCDYTLWYTKVKNYNKKLVSNIDEFYDRHVNGVQNLPNDHPKQTAINQWTTEWEWADNKKPYYNVYPGIVSYLAKLKEDRVLCNQVRLPIPMLLFRFSKTARHFRFNYLGDEYFLRTILASDRVESIKIRGQYYDKRAITLWLDFGETETIGAITHSVYLYRKLVMDDYVTLNEAMNKLPMHTESAQEGVQAPYDFVEQAVRTVCSCCLLSTDAEDGLIEPEVLSQDKDKFKESYDQKYVDKAQRRGKVGWNIGANLEVAPHWRSGSPLALYWTGAGKAIPRYRPRKGCIVHRDIAKKIPTGFKNDKD